MQRIIFHMSNWVHIDTCYKFLKNRCTSVYLSNISNYTRKQIQIQIKTEPKEIYESVKVNRFFLGFSSKSFKRVNLNGMFNEYLNLQVLFYIKEGEDVNLENP